MANCQWDREVKARKKHICSVCGTTIPPATTYHKQTGIFDGDPYTWKAHTDCAALYWMIQKGRFNDELFDIYDFGIEAIEPYRGQFPHAVCRIEKQLDEWSKQ